MEGYELNGRVFLPTQFDIIWTCEEGNVLSVAILTGDRFNKARKKYGTFALSELKYSEGTYLVFCIHDKSLKVWAFDYPSPTVITEDVYKFFTGMGNFYWKECFVL